MNGKTAVFFAEIYCRQAAFFIPGPGVLVESDTFTPEKGYGAVNIPGVDADVA